MGMFMPQNGWNIILRFPNTSQSGRLSKVLRKATCQMFLEGWGLHGVVGIMEWFTVHHVVDLKRSVCFNILPWSALRRTGSVLKRTKPESPRHRTTRPRTSHQQHLDTSTTAATSYTCYFTRVRNSPRGALHIRVITSASAQRCIIWLQRLLLATPDDGQATCPKHRVI